MSSKESQINSRKFENFQTKKYLIISEDSKSFVQYFNEIIKDYGFGEIKNKSKIKNSKILQKTSREIKTIEIISKNDSHKSLSCPVNNVKFAIENIDKYQKIFCVFDYSLEKFQPAIKLAKQHQDKIEIIDSNPCFEYWLYLHFNRSTKQFLNQEKLINELEKEVNKKLKSNDCKSKINFKYNKGIYPEYFMDLLRESSNHKGAIKFAKINFKDHNSKTINPSTKIYQLFEFFKDI
jgi:hypothetical protein